MQKKEERRPLIVRITESDTYTKSVLRREGVKSGVKFKLKNERGGEN